jgi:hypothetical protein
VSLKLNLSLPKPTWNLLYNAKVSFIVLDNLPFHPAICFVLGQPQASHSAFVDEHTSSKPHIFPFVCLFPHSINHSTMLSVMEDHQHDYSRLIITSVASVLALVYIVLLFWSYRYAQQNRQPINKASGIRLQKFGPVGYAFMVFTALVEAWLTIWLLLEYRTHNNFPSNDTRVGILLLL